MDYKRLLLSEKGLQWLQTVWFPLLDTPEEASCRGGEKIRGCRGWKGRGNEQVCPGILRTGRLFCVIP